MVTDTLVISDLHLGQAQPGLLALFRDFMTGPARSCRRLLILGDLFDAWIGDDDEADPTPLVRDELAACAASGVAIHFMPGNRDFLLGQRFAKSAGMQLLDDPTVLTLGGEPVLLMHGDLLCTDDTEYQKARLMLRSPQFIEQLLAKPLEERRLIAAEYRRRSGEAISNKAADIMDANPGEVQRRMRQHGVQLLIHGHTHRPAEHHLEIDGRPARRLVLPAWEPGQGGYLALDAKGWRALAVRD